MGAVGGVQSSARCSTCTRFVSYTSFAWARSAAVTSGGQFLWLRDRKWRAILGQVATECAHKNAWAALSQRGKSQKLTWYGALRL
jgi:hypothetical protein